MCGSRRHSRRSHGDRRAEKDRALAGNLADHCDGRNSARGCCGRDYAAGSVRKGATVMSDYDTDILTWSERQAALLRRRAAGELINDADLDWLNIAEEI